MEHILPDSIAKLERCLPSTPEPDASMSRNFTTEHSQILLKPPDHDPAVISRSGSESSLLSLSSSQIFLKPPGHAPALVSRHEMESSLFSLPSSAFLSPSSSMTLPPKQDRTSPSAPSNLSNWAHLSLIKTQRNSLSTSLKATQAAHNEARASVAALRRLAFRLAVNISVKEKKIATSVRSLAASRKNEYVLGTGLKGAERRVGELEREWREERQRNREILESLERASALTLQYSNPSPTRKPASPPASPPTRVASLSHYDNIAKSPPRTPTHSPQASKSWEPANPNAAHYHRHPSTPGTPQIRTPSDRLIQAKRDSDHALLVARSRIEALQADCFRSKEIAKQLELNRMRLEGEIASYKTRVTELEGSRAAVKATLRATEGKFENSIRLEKEIRSELDRKTSEIRMLEDKCRRSETNVKELGESNRLLEEDVENCREQIAQLEKAKEEMEEEVIDLKKRIKRAEHGEAELESRLAAGENEKRMVRAQLDKSAANVVTLEKAAAFFEEQIRDYNDRIRSLEGSVSWLDDGLKTAHGLKNRVDSELEAMRFTVSEQEYTIASVKKSNANLQAELKNVREAKSELESALVFMKERLLAEEDARAELHKEVRSLRHQKGDTEGQLQAARIRIEELDRPEVLEELQSLKSVKISLEQRLESIQKSSSDLKEELSSTKEKLQSMEGLKTDLITQLQNSEEKREDLESKLLLSETANSSLNHEIQFIRHSQADTEERLLGLKVSLEAELREAETTNTSLQNKFQQIRDSKAESEELLRNILRSKSSLESKLRDSEIANSTLQHDAERVRDSEAKAREQLHAISQSQASLETQLAQSEARNASLQHEVEQIRKSEAETREHLDSIVISQAALENRLTQSESSNTSLQYEVKQVRHSETEAREQLHTILESQASLEIQFTQSESNNTSLQHEIQEIRNAAKEAEQRLQSILESKASLESKLAEAENANNTLRQEIQHIRDSEAETGAQLRSILKAKESLENQLSQSETNNTSLQHEAQQSRQLAEETEQQLRNILKSKISLESKLLEAETANDSLEQEIQRVRQSAEGMERQLNTTLESKASLETKLRESETSNSSLQQEVQQIRKVVDKTEEELRSAKGTFESKLSAAESNSERLSARLSVADLELGTLRATTAAYESSERDLSARLDVAENELIAVRRANQEFEEFLDSAENDMLMAEAFTVDCQTRLEGFVNKTNTKLAVAERSRGKYKRRLASTGKALEILKGENETLSSQLEQKSNEIEVVKREDARMKEELVEKDRTIETMQRNKAEYQASMDAIELELKELKESKETFEKLVHTLQEKTKTLDILNEWDETPSEVEDDAFYLGPRGFELYDDSQKQDMQTKESNTSDRTKSLVNPERPRLDSAHRRSIRSRRSLENTSQRYDPGMKQRPFSQYTDGTAGTPSEGDAEMDSWAKEVERVRILRDEAAVQLKGIKKLKVNLRKSLKNSELELEQLEKKARKEQPASRPSSSYGNLLKSMKSTRSVPGVGSFDKETGAWSSATPRPHTSLGLEGVSFLRPGTASSKKDWSGGFSRRSALLAPSKELDELVEVDDVKEAKKGWRVTLRGALESVGRKRSPLVTTAVV